MDANYGLAPAIAAKVEAVLDEIYTEHGGKPPNAERMLIKRLTHRLTEEEKRCVDQAAAGIWAEEIVWSIADEHDAAALAGRFADDQWVMLSRDGTMIERQHMQAADCRQRLAFLVGDRRPEREAERVWLRQRVEQAA